MVDAGQLDQRIQIQRVVETRDVEGGIVLTWSTWISRWASIRPLRGTDKFLAQQEYRELSHEIRLHSDSETREIKTKDRIKLGDRIFDIHSIIRPMERNQDIVLTTMEKAD